MRHQERRRPTGWEIPLGGGLDDEATLALPLLREQGGNLGVSEAGHTVPLF
jgi:hypothetical protein